MTWRSFLNCRKWAPPVFAPCINQRSNPASRLGEPRSRWERHWIHEIKHDGYRLIVQRDGQRVRLFTSNGHGWSGRFPLFTEAALRNRNSAFVIDGEAVLLGVDGVRISTVRTLGNSMTKSKIMHSKFS
jgi:ATP-dependent DNA ligase